MENRVKVNIFGQTYNVQGDASSDYITELSDYINKKMEDVSTSISNNNPSQVAILVALNIADEYFQLKKMKSGMDSEIEERATTLISMLDDGLIGDIFTRSEALSS